MYEYSVSDCVIMFQLTGVQRLVTYAKQGFTIMAVVDQVEGVVNNA